MQDSARCGQLERIYVQYKLTNAENNAEPCIQFCAELGSLVDGMPTEFAHEPSCKIYRESFRIYDGFAKIL